MNTATLLRQYELETHSHSAPVTTAAPQAAVSWGAIVAGAFAAAALSLILLALGSGLGLSSVSPWAYGASSISGFGPIAWLFLMSAAASGIGGYIAGRLRTRWTDVHSDEVYFRDTAHGLIAWAVATVFSAAVLGSAAASMAGVAARTVVTPSGAATNSAVGDAAADAYFADLLFRAEKPADTGLDMNSVRSEAARILRASQSKRELSAGDKAYLAGLVAARTGLSTTDAEQRVVQVFDATRETANAAEIRARDAANAARQAAAYLALWIFASLLTGAFCAALAATFGGRRRDGFTRRTSRA